METKRTCQHCGKPLGTEAIEGLCPECLMKVGLGIGTEATGPGPQDKRAFIPPTIAELGPRFPHFEIIGLIGHGGMGAVYKARQKQLERVVALKILPPGIGEDLGFADRFAREAKAMARLNHPGIVTIHDFGCADGLYFLVMEFVDGVSLGQLMRTGRVSPREALAIVPQICDALQYAHDQGIVHRDIKPENILLDRQGRVKVADFGLAKLVGVLDESQAKTATAEGAALTQVGKTMGTPSYMAPEQAQDPGAVDHRADIYALGVVFYQMLTGELPSKPIEAPSTKVRIDVRLDDVVLCALEKTPERRYQQVSLIKTAVETIAQTSGGDTKKNESGPDWRPRSESTAPRLKGRVLAGIIALVVVGLLSFLLARTRRAHQAESDARAAEMRIRLTPAHIVSTPEPPLGSQPERDQPNQVPEWVNIKPLADWIADLRNGDPKIQKLAGEAIGVMRTNALPEFLKILSEKEPTAEDRERHYQTAQALRFVGPELKSAIPAFLALLKGGGEETSYSAATALAFSTSVAPEAWAVLTNGLVDPEARVRDAATHGVGLLFNLDSSSTHLAEPALPMVVKNLKDDVDYVRADTAAALYLYAYRHHLENHDARPGMIIPPLIEVLQDRYSWARIHAAIALGEYGTNANSAVSTLSNLLEDPDPQVRSAATNALRSISSPRNHVTVLTLTNGNLPQDQKIALNTAEALPQTGSGFYFVGGGGVAIPGRHVCQPGLTVMAAIKASGGFTAGALKTKAALTRAGSTTPLVINLAAIEQGSASDPNLMPGDKLWVPAPPPTNP